MVITKQQCLQTIHALTTIAYCPVVKAYASLVGPWISRSFFLSFLAFIKLGTFSKNCSLGLSGNTTSSEEKTVGIMNNINIQHQANMYVSRNIYEQVFKKLVKK